PAPGTRAAARPGAGLAFRDAPPERVRAPQGAEGRRAGGRAEERAAALLPPRARAAARGVGVAGAVRELLAGEAPRRAGPARLRGGLRGGRGGRGSVTTGERAIRLDEFLAHPPARVWRALTDPDLLARWLMPNDFRPAAGHRFTFRTDPRPGFDGIVHCEVLTL